jgi:pyruvate dehydrogenase E2 component (dihydrolipoamide acetyltransferase)
MTATDLIPVEVPDIGDFEDVPVIEIHVAAGDTVAVEDPLLTLESDKATMDVPAPFAGTVREVHVGVGDRVSQGTLLVSMEDAEAPAEASAPAKPAAPAAEAIDSAASAEEQSSAPAEATASAAADGGPSAEAEGAPSTEAAAPAQPASAPEGRGPIYASPSARRLARELGVKLDVVSGSGRKGRITKEDVESARSSNGASATTGAPTKAQTGAAPRGGLDLLPWPTVDFEKFGPVERVERSRIQRIAGPNLARNWVMIPHVTHNDEADITDLEAWRKQLGGERSDVKVTMVSFLVVASVAALKEFPTFNSSLDGGELVLKRYYNIGFAADTPNGLVVPVIKNADTLGLLAIAGELTRLSGLARSGKLMPGDMQGATFTVSSLGGIGGTSFSPIINAPEVAILGATRSSIKPVWNPASSSFEPRLMLPLSLSYDHRVIDGAAAARFVVHLTSVLSDLRRALL